MPPRGKRPQTPAAATPAAAQATTPAPPSTGRRNANRTADGSVDLEAMLSPSTEAAASALAGLGGGAHSSGGRRDDEGDDSSGDDGSGSSPESGSSGTGSGGKQKRKTPTYNNALRWLIYKTCASGGANLGVRVHGRHLQ